MKKLSADRNWGESSLFASLLCCLWPPVSESYKSTNDRQLKNCNSFEPVFNQIQGEHICWKYYNNNNKNRVRENNQKRLLCSRKKWTFFFKEHSSGGHWLKSVPILPKGSQLLWLMAMAVTLKALLKIYYWKVFLSELPIDWFVSLIWQNGTICRSAVPVLYIFCVRKNIYIPFELCRLKKKN